MCTFTLLCVPVRERKKEGWGGGVENTSLLLGPRGTFIFESFIEKKNN